MYRGEFTPEIEPWAQREMEQMGVDIEEYCNIKGYNIHDILTEENEEDEEDEEND